MGALGGRARVQVFEVVQISYALVALSASAWRDSRDLQMDLLRQVVVLFAAKNVGMMYVHKSQSKSHGPAIWRSVVQYEGEPEEDEPNAPEPWALLEKQDEC
eukprot:6466645-Amphidinium_carterae.1